MLPIYDCTKSPLGIKANKGNNLLGLLSDYWKKYFTLSKFRIYYQNGTERTHEQSLHMSNEDFLGR